MAASSSASSSSALSRLSNIQNHLNPIDSHARVSKSHSLFNLIFFLIKNSLLFLFFIQNLVKISPEVSEALSHGHAVVALESTIISHGDHLFIYLFIYVYWVWDYLKNEPNWCVFVVSSNLCKKRCWLYSVFCLCSGMPYPQNFETAKEVEAIVRNNGAVPATIAILEGLPCVGVYIKLILSRPLWCKKSKELLDYWLYSDNLTWHKRCINSCEFSLWVIIFFFAFYWGKLMHAAAVTTFGCYVELSKFHSWYFFSFLVLWDFSFKHHFSWYLDPFFCIFFSDTNNRFAAFSELVWSSSQR